MSNLINKIKFCTIIGILILLSYMFIMMIVNISNGITYKKRINVLKNEIQQHFYDIEVLKCKIDTNDKNQDGFDLWVTICVDSNYNNDNSNNVFNSINLTKKTLEKYMPDYNEIKYANKVIVSVERGIDAPYYVKADFMNDNGILILETLGLSEIESFNKIEDLDNVWNISRLYLELNNISLSLQILKNFSNLESLFIYSVEFDDINSIYELKHLKELYLRYEFYKANYEKLKKQLPNTKINNLG